MENDLDAWLELFFRRRRAFAYGAGSILFFVMLVSFLCPPFFSSTAEIMIQQDRAQLLVSPTLHAVQDNQPTIVNSPPGEQDLNSELELLESPYVVEQALSGLKPVHSGAIAELFDTLMLGVNGPELLYATLHGVPIPTPQQRWREKVRRHLTCKLLKRSSIIELSFTSHSPHWSREFLTRLIDNYLEFRAALSHDPQAEHFFYRQADLLKAKLERSEDELRALKLQTGVMNLDDQEKSLVDQLSDFREEYRDNESQLAGINQRIDYLTQQLTNYPQRVDSETKVVQNMALQSLKPQVLALEAQRAELLSRYRPDSERIKSIDAKLEAANAVLQGENTREVQEVSSTINPTWQSLSSELAEAKANSAATAASQANLGKQVADYERQLTELTNVGVQIDRLQRQADTSKEAYLSYLRKGEEARAADALNFNKILNVSIAKPPTLPINPVFPSIPINLFVGIVLGCAGGIASVLWSELHDERVFSMATITKVSGLKTEAVLKHVADLD